jgi:hypothetical protein
MDMLADGVQNLGGESCRITCVLKDHEELGGLVTG